MNRARICCRTLLLLLLFLLPCTPVWPAFDDGPVTEIVLDCSLSMKRAGPEHSARIDLAWLALARHYHRIALGQPDAGRTPALRLAGGSTHRDNPWLPGQLVHDGSSAPSPFLPGHSLPPAPMADGLLPLSEALTKAAGHLHRRRNRSQGFIVLIAAGWEGGAGNPYDLSNGSEKGNPTPVIHVIGLAPLPAESRQLRQLAARSGGIYREVGGLAGLEQALHLLAGSGGIYFTASSSSGEPPPAGSRLRVADRRGWYRRDFDYQDWKDRGGEIWVPAGPYDLELSCSGRSSPFPVLPLSVERGRISRRRLTIPEQGLLRIQLLSPAGSTREAGATIFILDESESPIYRLGDRDQFVIPLFPGQYRARICPYRSVNGFGELSRDVRILPRMEEAIEILLPSEGLLVIDGGSETPHRVRIEDRGGIEVWSGRPEGPLSLPEGRYRLRVFGENGEKVKSKRFRIRGGETRRLTPFRR